MKTPNENTPTACDNQGTYRKYNPSGPHDHSTSRVNILLNRLENVHPYRDGWRARCPAHKGRSRNVLSIAQGGEGRILIHCFALCSPTDILQACGLEMTHLYPRRLDHTTTPGVALELRQLAKQAQWKAALSILTVEITILTIAHRELENGKPLSELDQERLKLAGMRIRGAKAVLCDR